MNKKTCEDCRHFELADGTEQDEHFKGWCYRFPETVAVGSIHKCGEYKKKGKQ